MTEQGCKVTVYSGETKALPHGFGFVQGIWLFVFCEATQFYARVYNVSTRTFGCMICS